MGKLLWKGGIALLLLIMVFAVAGCTGAPPDNGWTAFNADATRVFTGLSGRFTGLDATTGSQVFAFSPTSPDGAKSLGGFYGAPALNGDLVAFGATAAVGRGQANVVYALQLSADRNTVQQRWFFDKATDLIVGAPTVSDGTAYVTSADGHVYALDLQTGQQKWSFKASGPIWSGVSVEGDRLFVGSMGGTQGSETVHYVYALNAADGSQAWSFPTTGAVPDTPAVANGVVYAGDLSNKLYAIDAQTGNQKWVFTGAKGWIWGTPVVSAGTVYAASLDHNLYALDAGTGQVQWTFDAKGPVRAGPTLSGGTLFLATESQHLLAVDAATHAQLWDYTGKGSLVTSPVVVANATLGDTVYVTSANGSVYAVDAKTGGQRWVFPQPK